MSRFAPRIPRIPSVRSIVRELVEAGASLPAPVEILTGAALVALPIPEPTTEVATDVAGVVMIGHGLGRMGIAKRMKMARRPGVPSDWKAWASGRHPWGIS